MRVEEARTPLGSLKSANARAREKRRKRQRARTPLGSLQSASAKAREKRRKRQRKGQRHPLACLDGSCAERYVWATPAQSNICSERNDLDKSRRTAS